MKVFQVRWILPVFVRAYPITKIHQLTILLYLCVCVFLSFFFLDKLTIIARDSGENSKMIVKLGRYLLQHPFFGEGQNADFSLWGVKKVQF